MRHDVDRLVAAGYDAVADSYADLERGTEWPRMRWLVDLLRRLPAGSRVLDLGCGSGVPVTRALTAAGHGVVGVDVSREQIRRARSNVPDANFRVASVLDVQFAENVLDAVVCLYVIDHVPRDLHATVLESIHGWLREGGWLLMTFETGDRPDVIGDWLGTAMFFSHFDAATNERLVQEAGFVIARADQETQLEGGRAVPYLWILARKQSQTAWQSSLRR